MKLAATNFNEWIRIFGLEPTTPTGALGCDMWSPVVSSVGGLVVISVTSHTVEWLKPEEGATLKPSSVNPPSDPHDDDDDDGLVINQVGVTPGVILRVMALTDPLRGCNPPPLLRMTLLLLDHFNLLLFLLWLLSDVIDPIVVIDWDLDQLRRLLISCQFLSWWLYSPIGQFNYGFVITLEKWDSIWNVGISADQFDRSCRLIMARCVYIRLARNMRDKRWFIQSRKRSLDRPFKEYFFLSTFINRCKPLKISWSVYPSCWSSLKKIEAFFFIIQLI